GIRDGSVTGVQTCALPILPSFAYNLILPTLYGMVGVNAFAVAFSLVAAGRGMKDEGRRTKDGSQRSEVGSQNGAEEGSQTLAPRSEERRVGRECGSRQQDG